jgi:DNA-binding response OmpR family regulator
MKPINKVLIVDDNVEVRDTVSIMLTRKLGEAIQIKIAGSVNEARALLAEFAPDLVMCDHDLPDGKGPELFAELRKQNDGPFICLMSGTPIREDLGAHVFVLKPELFELIDGVILFAKHRA